MVLPQWTFALLAIMAPSASKSWTCTSPLRSQRTTIPTNTAPPLESLFVLKVTNNNNNNDADDLQDQARKLREEIQSFEQQKSDQEQQAKRAEREAKMAVQTAKDFYCAVLPIFKPDGSTVNEKVEFTPVSKKQDTCIQVLEGALPLGMVLGEGEISGTVVVDEVAPGSNAGLAGVQVGDIVRACTACEMSMEAPTWQILAGGIGIPKTRRIIYVVDGRPFEEVMDAVASNRMDPDGRPVVLAVERKRR